MAVEKKKFPIRLGTFKVISGQPNQVEDDLNVLMKTGFVDVQGTTANGNNNITLVIYFKPFVKPAEEAQETK